MAQTICLLPGGAYEMRAQHCDMALQEKCSRNGHNHTKTEHKDVAICQMRTKFCNYFSQNAPCFSSGFAIP